MREYEEVRKIIEGSRRFGARPGAVVTAGALEVLKNPMKGMDYLHVAGTNGKGSVCAFLSAILKEAGLRTGTFTSPHLIHFEERICVDGEKISKEDVKQLGNILLDTDFGGSLTMFDYCLLMAVLYFRERKCDVTVMETGLGGRLDSTNALGIPEVAVITQIGLDHRAILGDTIEEIAAEKAGIIKPGCPVVAEKPESRSVLEVFWKKVKDTPGAELFVVSDEEEKEAASLKLRMRGSYQAQNAAAAARAAKIYLCKNKGMSEKAAEKCCRAGLKKAFWPGRMQLLSPDPFLLVDGAHNPQGVCALAKSLKDGWPGEKFHFIMGVMADKDYADMITPLLPLALDFITVTPDSGRALQAKELAGLIRERGKEAGSADSIGALLTHLPGEGKTVAFGSLYFVGEILDKFFDKYE